MLSSIARPAGSYNNVAHPLLGSAQRQHRRYYDELSSQDRSLEGADPHQGSEDSASPSDEDGEQDFPSLLPIFSAAHLDALPVYNLTHTIRILIEQRCETTLSWDQLRSPQVSQFLIKPIQLQIRSSNFSRATLYALLANCLQFSKEGQVSPGNVGVLRTRSAVAELLAIRLLKEFSVRELIDALSYDFDPLQGMELPDTSKSSNPQGISRRINSARTSTLEVAIRAQAKRFLAHPLVVQHLEAIWAGSIVFHSAADNLHRMPIRPLPTHHRHYGATHIPSDDGQPPSENRPPDRPSGQMIRRSVTLYNPNDASLFKLSRLRVPRYRQIFSMLSYAAMLGLFVAVLVQRSLTITPLEIIFCFWSTGFMLDEILGFTEQGFNLYIMSVWNAFDMGILLLFSLYYLLRLYGIVIADDQKQLVAEMAYDILASTAVLLFPRLFSLLDHYRYFSQLLIAFRLMAQDLAAVLILIAITCSGFFVSFTLAFGKGAYDGSTVAYELFQILMGFTPAAWEVWSDYNILGKLILTLFLVICHFLVVTIMITVLTNSFMAIVRNANEEHQFLFAVNVLSMVKSDALFSYIAPSNIIGWMISPLRFLMPLRQFVKINRNVIKLTHFPILWLVFAYEKFWLSSYAFETGDLIERTGREKVRPLQAFGGNTGNDQSRLTPSIRVREPSVTTRYKDQALEEVFRRPFGGDTLKDKPTELNDRPSSAVDQWMSAVTDIASPPPEQPRSVLDRAEIRRPNLRRSANSLAVSSKRRSTSRSVASESNNRATRFYRSNQEAYDQGEDILEIDEDNHSDASDAEEDSELIQNDQNQIDRSFSSNRLLSDITDVPLGVTVPKPKSALAAETKETLQIPKLNAPLESTQDSHWRENSPARPRTRHNRQASANTIVFNPIGDAQNSTRTESQTSPSSHLLRTKQSSDNMSSQAIDPHFKQRLANYFRHTSRPGPKLQYTAAAGANFSWTPSWTRQQNFPRTRREASYDTLALDLASDIGDNRHVGMAGANHNFNEFGPGSFGTQVNLASSIRRQERRGRHQDTEESNMLSRMVLARMNTLEEGFKDMLKEMKEWRRSSSRTGSDLGSGNDTHSRTQAIAAHTHENATVWPETP